MSRRTKEIMYPLIEKWRGSDCSKSEFCHNYGVNIGTFIYWERKHANEESPLSIDNNFVSLKVSGLRQGTGEQKVEIYYPNGVRISVSKELSESFLTSLLGVLS